jgi:hypothetical protein
LVGAVIGAKIACPPDMLPAIQTGGKVALAHGAYIETTLFKSKAYQSLTRAEERIYFYFLLKREFGNYKGKPGKRGKIIKNNGRITFTYAEAVKYGFPRPTFRRAIDKLVDVGLIDITYQGQGGLVSDNGKIMGESSLYAVSERWEDYGKKDFIIKPRQKDNRKGRGWAVYHEKRKNRS